MENNDIEAVYNLMQKILDSNKSILKELKASEKEKHIEPDPSTKIKIDTMIRYLSEHQEKLINAINRDPPPPNTQYILFGKDSPMNTKFFFVLGAIILICWFGFKYITPQVMISQQEETELQNYRLTNDYLFLKKFEDTNTNTPFRETFERIGKNDTIILKDFKTLKNKYEKAIKIKELENQINKLK